MPQISPMNWLFLMTMFLGLFSLTLTKIYYLK